MQTSSFKIYEKARRVAHWNPRTAIAFDRPTRLSAERQEEAWRMASQSVYAEEVGMMQAARLLTEVDDITIRYCLATAVSDEAKHSEVFARYAIARGGSVAPDGDYVNLLFGELEAIPDSFGRFIAHSMLEGLAADQFSLLRRSFEGDVLEDIYRYVSTDEARHVGIGIDYMSRVLRDTAFEEHVHALEQYSRIALDISGMEQPEVQQWLGELVGQPPERAAGWMLARHRQRIDRLLSKVPADLRPER